jgi:hypothetical protein
MPFCATDRWQVAVSLVGRLERPVEVPTVWLKRLGRPQGSTCFLFLAFLARCESNQRQSFR